jgi:hypothetical protein
VASRHVEDATCLACLFLPVALCLKLENNARPTEHIPQLIASVGIMPSRTERHRSLIWRLGTELLEAVQIMDGRARCKHCAIPKELRRIASRLRDFSRMRVAATESFDRRFDTSRGVRFFYQVARHFTNQFVKYETQLLDCQRWVDVVTQTMGVV